MHGALLRNVLSTSGGYRIRQPSFLLIQSEANDESNASDTDSVVPVAVIVSRRVAQRADTSRVIISMGRYVV